MLGHYLAGLIEGDGSIIVPKTLKNEKGKLLHPKVKITFVGKDLPLAKKLKEILGAGTIEYPREANYIIFLVQDVHTLQKIAVLLNGRMRTPKIEALHRLIDWLNARNLRLQFKNPKIPKLELDNSNLGDNPWLSGFIDSDGYFYCGFNLNSEGIATIVKHYMSITQKRTYGKKTELPIEKYSNLHVMENIREFLDVKTISKLERNKENYVDLSYEVRTSKKASCAVLMNYLAKYPLFSSKHQDYLSWCEVHKIRVSREYKTIEGTKRLIHLKNSMNTQRTQFNWDSLNNFYI